MVERTPACGCGLLFCAAIKVARPHHYTTAMFIPHVPQSVPCAKCGEMVLVVRTLGRQGEQLVIARIDGKFYITVDCPECGKSQQEIEALLAHK